MKKFVSILTIGLLLSLCFSVNSVSSSNIESTTEGTTLYVDDDFNETTHGWNVTNFSSIQDAINKAENNDTVFVYNGTYYENLIINKPINLIGENKENTIIIDSNIYDTIYIYSTDNVTISNFQIRKNITNESLGVGALVISGSNNIRISRNLIKPNCANVIELRNSNKNNISHNIIQQNHFYNPPYHSLAIRIYESDDNIITENDIRENNCGISITRSNGNEITRNNFISINPSILAATFSRYGNLPFIFQNNRWYNNYWNRPRIFPKLIIGSYSACPNCGSQLRIDFDWHPALKPYEIN